MAKMKFTAIPEEKKQPKSGSTIVSFLCDDDEIQKLNDFTKPRNLVRNSFIAGAVVTALEEVQPSDKWQEEPFTIKDAAERWGLTPTWIRMAINGIKKDGKYVTRPLFRKDEYKKLPGRYIVVTRRGMNRVFGARHPEKNM